MGQVHLSFSAVLTGGVNDCSKATWLLPSSHCFSCSFVHPRASARTSWWSGQQLKTGQCSAFPHPCQSREVFREQKAVFIPLPGLGFKSLFLVVMNSACVSARVCCPCWWKRRRACTTVQRMLRPYPPAWKVGRKQEDVGNSRTPSRVRV